jgi:Pro-kumamolisin, activation domain/Bacterial Ig-like domain (group 3)
MQPKPMVFRGVLSVLACLAFFTLSAGAQQIPSPEGAVSPRITQPVDEANRVTLKGNTHPLARPEFDLGPAPANLPLNRMLLVLSRSPEQEAALETLLDQQQDKSSPNYHNWLTPEQFGQQFGPADQDVQAVTSWLETHGFQVSRVSKGRVVIEFSGTASQLQEAFHTEIHKYAVNGEEHWANASDPQIPVALAPVVAGVKTLHDFYKKSQILITGEQFKFRATPGSQPEFTASNGVHALAPADYATIYNINPLYTPAPTTPPTPAINGTGTTIAVVGRSDFLLQDVIDFRNLFSLPANTPLVVTNGPDPGILNEGEQFEATLDVTWSGAVAPGAQVIFVVSASTNTTDGLDLSEEYIIDNDLANVMTESFSGCEFGATSAEASSISSLAEQAAAEGITYMVSTGDSGAEGCDNPDTEMKATGPVSVNILASSPYTLGVGGTEFNDNANPTKYWGSTNQQSGLGSALSYIPEDVWNESCLSGCGESDGGAIWAGGGGASTLFTKPDWQSVVAGIPADGHRDLPDVSLTAAGHDPYLLCFEYSCEQGYFDGVSGTSASAPSFAGIMALVNQKTGSKQGQANYVLYRLAAQETLASCNASSITTPPASTCIFNDVTIGNNAVPGEIGYGTPTADYQSTVGYDRATGLGSVNVANLVNGWSSARSVVSATTLSITPSTGATHGTPLDVTISVGAAPPATGNPTGDVALIGDFGSSSSGETEIVQLTLSNSTASSSSVNQLPGGTYNVQAHYEGDGTFVPSDSPMTKVTILPEPSTVTASALTGTPPALTSFTSQTYGVPIYLQAVVAGKSGVGTPTGTITFTDSVQGALGSATMDNTGTATTSNEVFSLNGGSHSVTASYSGDASFKSGTSSPATFKLTPDPTTTIITPPAPLVFGTSPQLFVTINANSFGLDPTGTATLFNGSTQVGTPVTVVSGGAGGPLAVSPVYVPASGLPLGQSTVTVAYSGDSNYQASTSAPLTVSVVRPSVTTLTSSASTIMTSQNVTFTAKITSSQSGPAVTGTVQFQVVGNPINNLGTVPVANGQAQVVAPSLPAGTQQVTATYSGDSNYATSSATVLVTVNQYQSTTVLTTSNASVSQGSSVTFTATVTPAQSGGPALTGNVEFVEAGAGVANVSLSANGQAQFTTSSLPSGTTQILANYSGDTNYATSSGSLMETVIPTPTFFITSNSPTITVASPGQFGSTTLTFTGQDGFTGSTTLTSTMCSHLPSESTCSFSNPSTVSLTAQTTLQTVTLTIITTAPSSVTPSARRFAPVSWGGPAQVALACAFCLGLFLMRSRGRQRRWNIVLACVVFVAIATFPSCGGGGGSTGPPPNPGTPVGNYTGVTVTVTINGVTQSINTIAVNVE